MQILGDYNVNAHFPNKAKVRRILHNIKQLFI